MNSALIAIALTEAAGCAVHGTVGSDVRPVIGPGICDFCGEQAPALKTFDRAPMAGAAYCRKCAPLSETDADWPNKCIATRAKP